MLEVVATTGGNLMGSDIGYNYDDDDDDDYQYYHY